VAHGSTNGSGSSGGASGASAATPSKPNVKCASFETFRAFEDTCTSAQLLPANTIRLTAASDEEAARVKHLIVAAGFQGQISLTVAGC
jgi:hypothetical protein